jgi:uncharacterized membrane protein
VPPGGHGLPPGPGGGARPWTASEAIGFGWNAVTKNIVGLSLGFFVAILVILTPVYVLQFGLQFGLSALAGEMDSDVLGILGAGLAVIFSVLGVLASAFLAGGINNVMVRTARGEKVSIGDWFSGGRFLGKILVGQICLFIALAIGFVLCVIPGYILMIGTSMWGFFVVDKNMGGVDALKASWAVTNGHKVSIFVLILLQGLCALAGYLACGIGIFVAAPLIMVANAYVYLKLNGEEPRLPPA